MKPVKKIVIVVLILVVALLLSFFVFKEKSPTWQSQYDLGMKYLSDGKYEEAIIAFNAAIKIDARRPEAYISLAKTYMEIGDEEAAKEILEKGYEATNSQEILDLLKTSGNTELDKLEEALYPEIRTLDIPLTVDQVEVGKTAIDVPKKYYENYIGYRSNLMNDDSEDTVYNGFWFEEVANPLGHDENEFGFFFTAPKDGGPITNAFVNQRGLLCFGRLQIGDAAKEVLDFFHFNSKVIPGEIEWELDNGGTLAYKCSDTDNFEFVYKLSENDNKITVRCEVVNGVLYSIGIGMKK